MQNDNFHKHLEDLQQIRRLMAESTRFLSLSGLSGVGAGVVALIGAFLTWQYLAAHGIYRELVAGKVYVFSTAELWELTGIALAILIVAVGVAAFFSIRLARKLDQPLWSPITSRLLINLMIPLGAGAVFCLELTYWGFGMMVPGATLIFYGLALINASKYTLAEIRWLGLSEIVLGLIEVAAVGYGIWFWTLGFGVLHIVYGIVMYFRYER